jgi:hypothetical protein
MVLNMQFKSLRLFILFSLSLLTACDGSNPNVPGSGSNMAHAVATGIGTGIGVAAGHHLINGAVSKWQNRRSFRRR